MNRKIYALLFLTILLVGTFAPMASAFMPRFTHKLIHQTATANPIDSELYRACAKYPSLCYSGNVLTDISVIWYWTEGYKYAVTHSPNFCRALIEEANDDQELACAVGGCMHQPADIVSHTEMVPHSIRNSLLANVIIHVFAEQQVDDWVEKNYPGVGDEALNYLSDYETCVPLFKRVMLGQEEYQDITEQEVNDKFDKFIVEIMTSQTGYDPAFEQKSFAVNFKAIPFTVLAIYVLLMLFFFTVSCLLLVKIFKGKAMVRHYGALFVFIPIFAVFAWIFIANIQGRAFSAVVAMASFVTKPYLIYGLTALFTVGFIFTLVTAFKKKAKLGTVIFMVLFAVGMFFFAYLSFTHTGGIVPLGNSEEYYVNKAIQNTKDLLVQGPQWLTDQEASGFTALEEADRSILLWDYLIIFALAGGLIYYLWYLFKKNDIKPTQTFSSDFDL